MNPIRISPVRAATAFSTAETAIRAVARVRDRAISSIWASRERRMCTARAPKRAQGINTLNPRMIWNRLRALFSPL